MDRLIEEACAIIGDAEKEGLSIAVLGGLAVRAWVGAIGRETFDIDLVSRSSDELLGLSDVLIRRGYVVRDDPWWRRAIRGKDTARIIVDFTGPTVVNPTSLERFVLSDARASRGIGERALPVIDSVDLFVLKLLAGRDQDVADVVLLATGSDTSITAAAAAKRARDQGLGARLEREAERLRFGLHTGSAQETAERLIGCRLTDDQVSLLEQFLDALMEAGDEGR